ncbi:MAG: serine/threonine-protein kinase [Polyangiaceae bacterium]
MDERSAPHPFPSGFPERVGRYELLLPIASGGMATVYLARSLGGGDFQREVALKLMHQHLRDAAGFEHDLIEEAKLAVRIRHPNVVPVLDADHDAFGVFLVMDYIEGDTLSGLGRASARSGGSLPLSIGLRILLDALAGLHAAHELSDEEGRALHLVHRDFSPQNILVGVDGLARLADFGIAKVASRLAQTATGMVKGKFSYMSPEQARARPLDRRSDLWSAGVIAWEICAGRRLHEEGNDAATLLEIVSRPPPRLRTLRSDLPAALDDAVARALALEPGRRPDTAAGLARALRDACGSEIDIADADEVARYVRRLVEPKLLARKKAATEILELRRRVAPLSQVGSAQGATPSVPPPRPPPMGRGATVPMARAVAAAAAATREAEATDTTSAVGAASAAPRHGRRAVLAVAGGSITALVLVALAWSSRPAPTEGAATSPGGEATAPAFPEAPRVAPAASEAVPAAAPDATTEDAAAPAIDPASLPAAPTPTDGPPRVAPGGARPGSAKASGKAGGKKAHGDQPTLEPNPYPGFPAP